MDKKKILVSGYTRSIHFYRWAHFLKATGNTVEILNFLNVIEFDYRKNFRVHDYSFIKKQSLKKLFIIINIIKSVLFIRRSNFDYINFCYIEFYNIIMSLLINKKIIFTAWGSDILQDYKRSKFIKKFLFNLAFKKALYITCDSQSVKNEIVPGKKTVSDKIRIIYFGIDPGLFKAPLYEEKNNLKNKFGFSKDSIILLSIRNVEKSYRILEIIEQFNKFTDKKIYLVIRVSPQCSKEYLKKCISAVKDNKNIFFIDYEIKYKFINELYKIADMNLHFPVSDSLPVSIFEGMACGNMIVCDKNIPSYQELSKLVELKLINLQEFNNDFVKKNYHRKNYLNRGKLLKFADEKVSIENLKKMFVD